MAIKGRPKTVGEEKSFTMRMPAALHKRMKWYVINNDISMKEYINELIEKDLDRKEALRKVN